ncbi:MAG: sulfatase [Bryobacteraceae bacterium]|nr:sulfatase [Bryobacteraceae bacterium]
MYFNAPGAPLTRRAFLGAAASAAAAGVSCSRAQAAPPNVLFIICDDLNDSVEGMGGHPQARTPNIHRLMSRAVQFTNGHSANPICAPARAALFSGMYPHHSGVLDFKPFASSELLKNSVSLFEHFKNSGYDIYGAGKLYHYEKEFEHIWQNPDGSSNLGVRIDYGPFPFNGKDANMTVVHPSLKYIEDLITDHEIKMWTARGEHSFGPLEDVPSEPKYPGWHGWRAFGKELRYKSDADRDRLPDELSAEYAAQVLSREHEKPFMLGVGFLRPHTPLYVPQKYFDMFPVNEVQLPPYKPDDLDDCQEFVKLILQYGFERHDLYNNAGLWKRFIQAYLAAVAFADEQVGRVLDALEKSPYADNTIVVFTSDHGWHMGEKNYNFKCTNWEESTRVPLVIAAPGVSRKGAACDHPVSHVDIYPTLVDLCGLPVNPNIGKSGVPLDGTSMRPFLKDPANGKWNGPDAALTVAFGEPKSEGGMYHNYTVRGRRWRYTLYENGAEELYDHDNDPNEWTNLAKQPQYATTKLEYRQKLLTRIGRDS